jgi:hypothetical protein
MKMGKKKASGHGQRQQTTRVKRITPVSADAAPARRGRGRPRAKHSDPNYYQLTIYVQRKVHREVKRELLTEDEPMQLSELVDRLMIDWLRSRGVSLADRRED